MVWGSPEMKRIGAAVLKTTCVWGKHLNSMLKQNENEIIRLSHEI